MTKSIWAEKYRPTSFDDLMYNESVKERVENLVSSEDFPHLLIYGPTGAGKFRFRRSDYIINTNIGTRTISRCILTKLFGESALRMKSEIQEFDATATTTAECVVHQSNHHIEITPSESGRHDKVIVNTVIKEAAGSAALNVGQETEFSSKVLIIHELEKLSKEAQYGLRRTMEKYMHNCRIIFTCQSLSKVILPLKSRCAQIRVPRPKREEVCNVLQYIAN